MADTKLESSISWLDYAEDDRRKMMEIVSLFKLRETRDELGLGSIRNIFAEYLFPGTGTMQTRARYFLIVPWIYQRLERSQAKATSVRNQLRYEESRIINVLLESETDGVIGRVSGAEITRMPSNIYWYGLYRWGIFRSDTSQSQYQRHIEATRGRQQIRQYVEDGEQADRNRSRHWDPNLPSPPKDFPNGISLTLTSTESSYLREKIHIECRDSLMPFLIDTGSLLDDVELSWLHPNIAALPESLASWINHARNFSETIYGAALLYNYMLAEMDGREELMPGYERQLEEWYEMVSQRRKAYMMWDLPEFWSLIRSEGRIPVPTQQFVQGWVGILQAGSKTPRIEGLNKARNLIKRREQFLKRGRSRFDNKNLRELWGGAAGNFQMDYRWWVTKRMVNDIILGLRST